MKSLLSTSRKHDISFYASGRIDISAHVARKLSLAPGDVIDIACEYGELYLYVKLRAGQYSGRHIGRVWSTTHDKGTFRTCCKKLTKAILAGAEVKSERLRCPCGREIERNNTKYITIIYRNSL